MWHHTEHLVLWVYHCCITHIFLWLFWAILGRHASDTERPKCIILFANVMLLNDAVTSYVTSQHCMCSGHMTIYYERGANTLVGGFLPVVHPFIRFDSITRDPHVAGV